MTVQVYGYVAMRRTVVIICLHNFIATAVVVKFKIYNLKIFFFMYIL